MKILNNFELGSELFDDREISRALLFARGELNPAAGTRSKYNHPSQNTSEKNLYQL
jgi:hypothetical protein